MNTRKNAINDTSLLFDWLLFFKKYHISMLLPYPPLVIYKPKKEDGCMYRKKQEE
jgi:hypothetical protein